MMRILITAVLALAIVNGVTAQTTAGTKVITGSIGYKVSNSSPEKSNSFVFNESSNQSFYISPGFGYFIKDQLEMGIGFGLMKSKTEIKVGNTHSENDLTAYEVTPYLRKYFFLSEHFAITGTASAGYMYQKDSDYVTNNIDVQDQSYTTNNFIASLSPGLVFFASERVGLRASLGSLSFHKRDLTYTSMNQSSSTDDNRLILDFSPSSLNVGLNYYINR